MILDKSVREYQQAVGHHRAINHEAYRQAGQRIRSLLAGEVMVQIDAFYFCPREKILTLDGRKKKMDISNRIKVLEDSLSECLGIDDQHFEFGEIRKVRGDSDEPYVTLCLTVTDMMVAEEARNWIETWFSDQE